MGSEHSLSLYEGLSGTSSPQQTANVGIERRAGQAVCADIPGRLSKALKIPSTLAASSTCLPLPRVLRSRGT